MKNLFFLSAVLGLSAGSFATVIVSGPSFPTPSSPGTGLIGNYYGQPATEGDANDDAYVAIHSPVATFTSTAIDYPAGVNGSNYADSNTLSAFLGATDSATLSPSSVGGNTLGGQLITFTGYIELQAGDNDFSLGVDDGGYVSIAGQHIIDNDGNHSFGAVSGVATVTIAGLYPIHVDYHEAGGNTGVTFHNDSGVVQTSVLYQTPEPASLSLLGLGGLSLLARRRKA